MVISATLGNINPPLAWPPPLPIAIGPDIAASIIPSEGEGGTDRGTLSLLAAMDLELLPVFGIERCSLELESGGLIVDILGFE